MIGTVPSASADDGGTTYTWIGNTQDPAADNHTWGEKKNWEPQGVPKDGDSVVIELPPGRCAAHVDGVPATELKNFTMQGQSQGCGVSVTGGHLTVTGLFQWNGGTIDTPLTMDGIGSIMGLSQQPKVLSRTMDVTGTMTMTLSSGPGSLRIDNPNVLHIKPGGTLISTGSNDIRYLSCCVDPAHVLNEGTLQILTGTLNISAVQFDQRGTLKIGGGGQLVTTRAPVTAGNNAKYSGSGSWNIGVQAVARFSGTQQVESPFRLVLGGDAANPGGRLGGTFTLAGAGGRLDWLAGRIEGNMTVAHGFSVRAYGVTTRRSLYGRDYTGATPVPAAITNHGTISFSQAAGYTGGEQSNLVNAVDGVLNLYPGTRIDAGTCCVAPDKITNNGGKVVVPNAAGDAAVLNMVSLINNGGTVTIPPAKQLQLTGGAPATLASTAVGGGGRLLIAAPTKVSGTVKINAATNIALIDRGSLDGTAIISGTGSAIWAGGSISGAVTLSTVAGVTITPTWVKYLRNINGGAVPSTLRITVPTKVVAGTKTAINKIDLGWSRLTLAGTTSVAGYVEFFGGELVNTGTITFAPGAGVQVSRTNGEFVNSGTAKVVNGTLFIKGGDYWQRTGTTDIAAAATVTTYYSGNKVLITAGGLTGTGIINTSLYNDKGTVSPGSAAAGTLRVTGTFTQAATGTLAMDVSRTSRDRLTVDGAATLGGRLWLRTLGSVTPAVGSTQTVLTSAAFTWKASCAYTSGAGSSTGNWAPAAGPKNLAVVRRAGADTHC